MVGHVFWWLFIVLPERVVSTGDLQTLASPRVLSTTFQSEKKNTGKEATIRRCHLCSGVYQFDEETIKTSASSSENATFSFLIYKYIFIQIMIELRYSMIVTVLIKFKLRRPFLEFPESAFILNLIK